MRLLAVLLLLTATQVSGLIKDSSAEIVFPQALHFSLDLTIPAKKLVSATLTITPSGQQPIPINLDLKSALQGDDTTSTLSYTWRITVEHPLPLFTSVAYHWSLTATDGTVVTDDGSLIFADPRVDWTQSLYPQEHFNLTAPSSLTPMVDDLRQIHALLQQNTGQPLDVNLLVSSVDPGCTPYQYDINRRVAIGNNGTVVDCDPGIEAAVLAGYQVLILPSDLDPEDFITSALVQQAYVPLWGQKDLPAWFIDGLTQFYEPTAKDALLLPVQEAARGGTLNSLAQMTTISVPADDLWRAQSYGMVLYIADRIGLPGLFDLARVNAADFDTAYQQAMKLPLSALIPAWQQWIFTTGAQGDYGITPYQPPTSTPTVTPTASSTATATVTPSLTPTITPTASNTPPGFRSTYVPPPTVTPSLTFTPPPATVTPRAPGSLPSVTPTPTPLQQTVAQPAFQAGTATFLGLLLVLLIFLFFRLGNRR